MNRLLGLAVLLVVIGLGVRMTIADDPKPITSTTIATSVGECKVCHSDPKAVGLRDYTEKCGTLDFIRLDESVIWENNDPHRKAYAALTSALGKKMGEKLKSDVTTSTACLTCHATDTNVTSRTKTASQFVRSESVGIGCQACHGAGKEWQSEHYRIDESPNGSTIPWRTKSPSEKQRAGLVNLRDNATKAALCVSCHVGNPAEGKVITHEMYVAGHPPLPPFELSTYMNDEPAHWKSPLDLPYFQKLDAKTAHDTFSYFPEERSTTRATVIGWLTSLKAEVELLADGATSRPVKGLNEARFDCYACHHELKIPSNRQRRGYDGPPGRPPLKAWVLITASLIVEQMKSIEELKPLAEEYPELRAKLQTAIFAKPFGDPEQVIVAAQPMIAWADRAMIALQARPYFTADRSKQFEQAIAKALSQEHATADPEAVMTLAWAYRSLNPERAALLEKTVPTRVRTPDRLKRMNAIDGKSLIDWLKAN